MAPKRKAGSQAVSENDGFISRVAPKAPRLEMPHENMVTAKWSQRLLENIGSPARPGPGPEADAEGNPFAKMMAARSPPTRARSAASGSHAGGETPRGVLERARRPPRA